MKLNNLNKKILSASIILIVLFSPIITYADAAADLMMHAFISSIPVIGMPLSFFTSASGGTSTQDLLNAPIKIIGSSVLMAATWAVGGVVTTALNFGEGFLNNALDTMFSFGFTPNDNPYISEGWGIIRNIANAVLVLGLVVIAINIILGRQEDKAKKNLINFILIALLINFTPVICGFIIDGSNIITKSMLTGGISNSYSAGINNMLTTISTYATNGGNIPTAFAAIFVTSAFAVFAIFIYFLYAILFLARTVILWILVIVSPLAFASFIIKDMPQAKYIRKIFPSVAFWDDWWENFVQWCVIGIPAGLSIYISNKILVSVAAVMQAPTIVMAGADPLGPILQFLFAYSIPFIFLIAGFFITISSGGQVGSYLGGVATGAWAMSGGKALGWGSEKIKSGATAATDEAGKYASGIIPGATAGLMTGTLEGYRDAREGPMGAYDVLKGAVKGTAGGALTRKGQTEGKNYWKRNATETAVDLHLTSPDKLFKQDAAIRKEAEEEVKDMDFDDIKVFDKYSSRLSDTAKGVALEKYMEKSPDIISKLEAGPELEKRIDLLKTHGSKKAQMNALMALSSTGKAGTNDELAKKLGFDMAEVQTKHGGVNDMIINKFNSKDNAKYISNDFIKDSDNLAKMNSNHFSYIAQEKGRQGVTTINENADWGKFDDKLKKWFSDGKGAASVYNIKGGNSNNSSPAQPQNPTPAPTPAQPQQTQNPPTTPDAPGRRSV